MKGKILAGFVLIFLAITSVGYYSFESLSRLVSALERESRPNPKNLQLKEILFDLSNAESSVRAYSLTRDPNYLNPFYESLTTIDRKLSDLIELSSNDEVEMVWLDSMAYLIDHKYFVLNDLIELKEDIRSEDILNQVLANINRYDRALLNLEPIQRPDPEATLDDLPEVSPVEIDPVEEEKVRKPNIFQRIFGRRKGAKKDSIAESETSIAQSTPLEQNNDRSGESVTSTSEADDLDEFKEQLVSAVAEIRENEKTTAENFKAKEIELFQLDNEIMHSIKGLMNLIEERERQLSLDRSANLQAMAKLTQDRIYWIGGISLALFTILVVIIIRDVTVNNRTSKKLKEAKEEAEKLAKVKEEFMSNISHEIRTPINSILGFAKQLEKTSLNTRQKAYVDVLSKSGHHLLALINDVLDYSKLESGSVTLEEIGFNPITCANEVKEALLPFAESKSLSLTAEFDNVPEILIGDPVRFRQILINLINNAIKFTKKGNVSIKLEAVKGAGRCKLLTSVTDSGIGIPASKIFSIFRTFNQVDNSTTREYGGSGLGLSICKKLVDAQKGKIWVKSKEGQGSTFYFEIIFPIGEEKDLPDQIKKPLESDIDLGTQTVLVVDDEPYNLLLFRTMLENHNAEVITTDKPLQVGQLIKDKKVDIILMDIQMPGMDGITLTKKLRSEGTADTPILALTATANKAEKLKCIEAGFDGFLIKPVEESELIETIASFIDWDPDSKQSNFISENEIDLDNLFEIGNNDLDFVYNMLILFRNNFSAGLNELKESVSGNDLNKMSEVAHKMIPPCRHLGLDNLVELLKNIENADASIAQSELQLMVENLENISNKIISQVNREIERIKPPQIKS